MREDALLAGIEARLLEAERLVDLLGRCTPGNFSRELERARGSPDHVPRFEYGPALGLERVDELFELAEVALSRIADVRATLLGERLAELVLERRIVAARGRTECARLAEARYPFSATERDEAGTLAELWLSERPEEERAELVELAPFAAAHALVRQHSVVVSERELPSLAALAGDELWVRRGARVSEREAERVVQHELLAHCLPRRRARAEGPPFRLGTRGCSEEEEGRAVWLERRAGLLSGARRRELAARHLAADWCRAGATLPEVRRRLVERGVDAELASRAGLRALRGGPGSSAGLGRERIYLAAFSRLAAAFEARPELERWFERGRLSLEGIAQLERVAPQSSKSTTTGA